MRQHHAIIATTWCIDSADSMNQWCATIPGMTTARTRSDGYHTIVLTLSGTDQQEGKALRDLFMEALLEDDFDERWDYTEVGYGTI